MKLTKTRLRSMLSDANLEWLMIAGTDGPDTLSDEQADAIIDMFRDWPDKQRYIPLLTLQKTPWSGFQGSGASRN